MSRQVLCRRRTTIPAVPTGASASAGNTTCSVAFTPSVTNGGSPITQYRAISTPGGFTNTGSSSPIVVSGLTNGVSYTFTVRATNALGNSAESAASNAAVPQNPATVPGQPTGVSATPGAQPTYADWRATVSFTAPASDGGSAILDYLVQSSPYAINAVGASSPITDTGLPTYGPFTFYVYARNAVGYGPASAASNSVTPTSVPQTPAAPTGVAGPGKVTVTISLGGNNGGSAFTSATATSSPGGFTATTYAVGGGTAVVDVTGLTNGVSYTFTAKVANAVGSSLASSASASYTPNVVNHTVSLNKSSITKFRLSAGLITDTCTATPVNGVGPFVYAWSWISGGSGLTLYNPTIATTTIEGTETTTTSRSGTARCTVTDNGNGGYSAYADCDVEYNWEVGS